jgi:hypothetical protein
MTGAFGQPAKYRLAQHPGQPVATVLAGARVGQRIGRRLSVSRNVSSSSR